MERPGAGEKPQTNLVRKHFFQGCPTQPSALQAQIRPAQAGRRFTPQQQVDPPATRVEINEQRLPSAPRQRGGEHRRTPAAGAGGNRDDPTTMDSRGTRLGVLGQVTNQFGFLAGKRANTLSANIYRRRPSSFRRPVRRDQRYPVTAGHVGFHTATRPGLVHDHGRSGEPALPSRELRPGYPRADRRHDALSAHGQLGVVDHGQDGGRGGTHGANADGIAQLWRVTQRGTVDRTELVHKRDDPRQGGRRRGSSCISPGGSG